LEVLEYNYTLDLYSIACASVSFNELKYTEQRLWALSAFECIILKTLKYPIHLEERIIFPIVDDPSIYKDRQTVTE
jgi:hypothetical protein